MIQAIRNYIREERLLGPLCVFGGLFGVLALVTLAASVWGPSGFWKHVLDRNIQLHLFAAMGLWMLFSRLLMIVENRRKRVFGWFVWYGAPVLCVLAISLTQEYGYSMLGESRGTVGGDWAYNKGSAVARAKSFADTATWMAGSLIAAWYAYFSAVRNETGRNHYLQWRFQRRRRRGL